MRVQRSDLGPLREVAEGGFARVYDVHAYHLPGDSARMAYKEFTTLAASHARSAENAVSFRDRLNPADRAELDRFTAWPRAAVEEQGTVVGVLMPRIPGEFFFESTDPATGDKTTRLRELRWLIATPSQLAQHGIASFTYTDRLMLLGQLVYAIGLLHEHGWVFGDMSFNNEAFTVSPPRMILLDCDQAADVHDPHRKQAHSLGWDPPECAHRDVQDQATDVYKLGLAILRCLNPGRGAATTRDPARVTGRLDAARAGLVARALDPDPARRPTAAELYACVYGAVPDSKRVMMPPARALRLPDDRGGDQHVREWLTGGAPAVPEDRAIDTAVPSRQRSAGLAAGGSSASAQSVSKNLPVLVNRFRTALKMDNPRRRNSTVSNILADLDAQIDAASGDYGLVIREANRNRVTAQDAAAKERRHADAVDAAVEQGDEETAVRQDLIRREHAADVEHYRELAAGYDLQAELQLRRRDELIGLSADLRREYDKMVRADSEAKLTLDHQQHLAVYGQVQAELDTAREVVHAIQIEAAEREALLSTNSVLEGGLLAQKSKRQAAEEEIRRRVRDRASDGRLSLPRGDGEGGSPGAPGGPTGAEGSPVRRRYLKGQCQESVTVGKPFILLASIVLEGPSMAGLKLFGVPSEGRDVLLVVSAPGLRLLGDQRAAVHVLADRDSEPVMFELQADAPGARSVSVTAWLGGTYLGELLVGLTAERDRPPGPHRDVLAEISAEPAEGAVSLVVRYDPLQQAYRFEFRDEDNPGEVTSNLAYDPGPRVERLIGGLDEIAKGRSGYSATQVRDYLVNAGAELWTQLIPSTLREQFWDRQHRIRQLTILADKDAIPWELLYPRDPGHDAGFLVEQFPVTRAIFGRRPARTMSLRPARFVLPEGSLPEARSEIQAMRHLLDPGQPPEHVISALTPLQDLIRRGDFGLLHFACHNRFDSVDGSSIRLDDVQFTPTLLTTAAIDRVLEPSAPTIFMNACRSAGLTATYNRLDGWAGKFLEAGAAAFIGSLWAVSDVAAREFAQEFYRQLQAGSLLGEAVMRARQAAAGQPDDPTWLAYTVYGDPRAMVSQPS